MPVGIIVLCILTLPVYMITAYQVLKPSKLPLKVVWPLYLAVFGIWCSTSSLMLLMWSVIA